jgi:cation diffusion facilitator CzcD-associated flavoprotein CzcO
VEKVVEIEKVQEIEKVEGVEHFDVLVVGAGISGIDAGYHLRKHHPDKTFCMLETQTSFGGTWLTHKYPGIRSDSDLFTFGYQWKPWMSAPIATAAEILQYLEEAIDENDLGRHIRYGQTVQKAEWLEDAWFLTILDEAGKTHKYSTNFLWMCQGYYRHAQGYTPEWTDMDLFQGKIVHPQTWPDDLDYTDKRVVVIGSGATAATIVPAMAERCEHITLLQRSPTYFVPGLNQNELADTLRELEVPDEWTHEIVRRKILFDQQEITRRSFEEPEGLRSELIEGAREFLGDNFDIEKHFTPTYRPWQQRLAFIPDGDLFQGIALGHASVVTDEIERFTSTGILLKSGEELVADIIVTATGFDLSVMGDIEFRVEDRPVDFSKKVGYRGFMFTDVPNLAWVFGYFRASWTLRADLISQYLCRIFSHMKAQGADTVTPMLREEDQDMNLKPWVDPDNFNPGYLMRSLHLMPKQGDRSPWVFTQDYWHEKEEFPVADLTDGALVYDQAVSLKSKAS